MNPNTGEIYPIYDDEDGQARYAHNHEEVPPEHPIFSVGETVELRGHEFTIRKITKRDIVLRPVDKKAVLGTDLLNQRSEKVGTSNQSPRVKF